MFLGQCLQMQSDNTRETNRPGLVPFRQCKLTELLFTNFFPSSSVASSSAAGAGGCSHVRAAAMPAHDPQKAVMIVTADPLGDFNATSQILRYSSLAREVTVPRVPSLPAALANTSASRPASAGYGTRNRTPNMISDPSGPSAASEEQIQHLTTSLELLNHQLAEETLRRHVAERAWEATELRMDVLEMEVREECFADLEARLETERRRWLEAWAEEGERADERVDRKLAILGRGLEGDGEEVGAIGGGRALVHEGAGRRVEDLERENAALRERLEELSRALAGSQPVAAASSASSDAVPLDLGKTAPLSREPQPAEKEESPKKHPQPQPQPQPSPQKNASRRSTRLALQPTPNPQRQSRVHSSPLPDVPDAPSMDSEDSCSTVRLGHTPEASTDMDTDVDKENRTSITSSSSSTTTPACTTAAEPTPAVQTLQLDTELMARTPVRLVSSSNGNANGGATGGATGPRRGVARSTGKKTTALRALTGRRWDLGGLEGEGEE